MLWLVLWVACPLLLLLFYIAWKNVADADLTLLWKEQFGQKPGEMLSVLYCYLHHHHYHRHRHHLLLLTVLAPTQFE